MKWLFPGRQRLPKFRYAAFVSYRRLPEDSRWAGWLIETLGHFETPEELVRRGVPARIGELFRDDKEMAAQRDIAGYIKQALWDSEHLIVVCSGATPASDWVRAEISLFKHWGRAERIHTLLIDAEVERALPAELRYWRIAGDGPRAVMEMAEPAAVSVAPVKGKSEAESRALARDRLAAALLGCDLAKLREALARRERALTTYRYFEQMVSRRAVPEGVGEVPLGDVAHREATLRFESRGGRVERVSRINGSGSLSDNDEGVAQWDVIWRSDGSVEAIELRNQRGRLVTRQSFNRDATQVDFSTEAETAHAQGPAASVLNFVADEGRFGASKSEIVRHLLDYDNNGFVIGRRYARDQFNTPAEDALGNWGEGYERDARGCAIRTWFLGPDGVQKTQRNGLNHIVETFDAHARMLERAFFGADGKPALNKDGCARITCAYDAHGNEIERAYFSVNGEPVLHKTGYARVTYGYDARGNEIERAYFGADGEPVQHKDGNARSTKAYDARGNVIERAYFGADGKPVLHKDGYARVTNVHDARGNEIERAYFGVDGKPVLLKTGYARVTYGYDARGNEIERAYFGADGKPVLLKTGYARVTYGYDARGNEIERAYFGADGKPVLHKDGNARFTKAYDARGNEIERACFGVDGEPVLLKDGYARVTYGYDARGNVVEVAYFGADGKPVLDKDGCARFTNVYDARGNVTEWAYFGVNGGPTLLKDGYARATNAYDTCGNVMEVAYFGVDGKPVLDKDGYARRIIVCDARGNEIEVAYFGVNGEPVLHKDGYARLTSAYDARGNLIERAYFGVDGAAIIFRAGYHKRRIEVDPLGRLLRVRYFGVAGEKVARRNLLVENDHIADLFGPWRAAVLSGLLTADEIEAVPEGGFHEASYVYDARGDVVQRRFLDIHGAAAVGPNGFSVEEIAYDALGRPVRFSPRRPDHDARALSVAIRYDARGNAMAVEYPDQDGRLVNGAQGFAKAELDYDQFGDVISIRHLKADGAPFQADGVAA
jgi:hypothetical protein